MSQSQQQAWEREYRDPQLVTGDPTPQKVVRNFFRWLRKERKLQFDGLRVLDLGSGTGRNANALAEKGSSVVGIEIAPTAVQLAKQRAGEAGLVVDYRLGSIGDQSAYADFKESEFDLVLDVTSSNALLQQERRVYLREVARVLKPGGIFFVRVLCKDGDRNAKKLIEMYPGPEKDTYRNPDMDLVEHVYSRQDFEKEYGVDFNIISLEKTTSYTRFGGQSYKRNFLVAILEKSR